MTSELAGTTCRSSEGKLLERARIPSTPQPTARRQQGVVYRLSRGANGHWKAAIQYSFTGGANGGGPSGAVVMDKTPEIFTVRR